MVYSENFTMQSSLDEQIDSRINELFLMSSPTPILLLLASYILFVNWAGPWWMKDRRPYDVKKTMMIYNVLQIVVNIYSVYLVIRYAYLPGNVDFLCFNFRNTPVGMNNLAIETTHMVLITRCLDLLDTVFMVLKKNFHQVTFLHVYHHVMVVSVGWTVMKYYYGLHVIFFGTLNCIVHAFMYFYYFLSAYNPSYKNSIWWKKVITQSQITQFVLSIAQQVYSAVCGSCPTPLFLLAIYVSQMSVMLYLFLRFYSKTYVKRKISQKTE